MSKTYNEIGMDADYTTCIRQFASLQVSGQATQGGSGSPYDTLFGDYAGSFSGMDSTGSSDLIGALLTGFLGGDYSSVSGMSSSGSSFLSDRALSEKDTLEYLQSHHFDATQLAWVTEDGKELELNTFYDTGKGYADLGLDNVYEFDEAGNLIADEGKYWISINGQPVAYYHMDTLDDGTNYTITGRVPCMLNGQRSNLMLVFDNEHEKGYVAGAFSDYSKDDEVDVVGKEITELVPGDVIEPLCDLYDYSGNYNDTYYIGNPLEITGSAADLTISDTAIGSGTALVTYRFTDMYGANHWTQTIQR